MHHTLLSLTLSPACGIRLSHNGFARQRLHATLLCRLCTFGESLKHVQILVEGSLRLREFESSICTTTIAIVVVGSNQRFAAEWLVQSACGLRHGVHFIRRRQTDRAQVCPPNLRWQCHRPSWPGSLPLQDEDARAEH